MPFLLMAKKIMSIIPLSFPKRSASISKLRNESNEYFFQDEVRLLYYSFTCIFLNISDKTNSEHIFYKFFQAYNLASNYFGYASLQ